MGGYTMKSPIRTRLIALVLAAVLLPPGLLLASRSPTPAYWIAILTAVVLQVPAGYLARRGRLTWLPISLVSVILATYLAMIFRWEIFRGPVRVVAIILLATASAMCA